jgi:hypothetical protein
MTDRTGCGLVELTVLQSLEGLTAGRPRAHVRSDRVTAAVEERIGLGPRYGYQVLVGLAQHWTIPVALVSGIGNFGNRDFVPPAEERYTESRQSHAGQLVLDAEAGRLAPVPVGLINGTVYRGGSQPALEPFRVLAALRRLLNEPRMSDEDVLDTVGPPYSVVGSEITGDLDALLCGRRAEIREAARIRVTDVPVPELLREPPSPSAGRRVFATGGLHQRDSGPPFAAHLVIESLPAAVGSSEAVRAITSRILSRRWRDSHPELAERAGLPVKDIYDGSGEYDVKIYVQLEAGTDPAAARDQLLAVDGVGRDATWAFPAPLAGLLRSWVEEHQGEDIAASLTRLEDAIRRDRAVVQSYR